MESIFEIALEVLFFYLIYRLIFGFIVPVYRSTKQVHKHMSDMQQRMEDQMRQQQQAYQASAQAFQKPASPAPSGDEEYIDYEEVK